MNESSHDANQENESNDSMDVSLIYKEGEKNVPYMNVQVNAISNKIEKQNFRDSVFERKKKKRMNHTKIIE